MRAEGRYLERLNWALLRVIAVEQLGYIGETPKKGNTEGSRH